MEDPIVVQHLIEIKSTLATAVADIATIKVEVMGAEQPGLRQRVDALEGHANRAIGAAGLLGFLGATIWTGLAYLGHYLKGGK